MLQRAHNGWRQAASGCTGGGCIKAGLNQAWPVMWGWSSKLQRINRHDHPGLKHKFEVSGCHLSLLPAGSRLLGAPAEGDDRRLLIMLFVGLPACLLAWARVPCCCAAAKRSGSASASLLQQPSASVWQQAARVGMQGCCCTQQHLAAGPGIGQILLLTRPHAGCRRLSWSKQPLVQVRARVCRACCPGLQSMCRP